MEINQYIDHTLLKPDATKSEIEELCQQATKYNFATVCVNPIWVSLATNKLATSPVKTCTVVGFPLGAVTTLTKVTETKEAIANGADEIDMVINIGALKAGDSAFVLAEIQAVVAAADKRCVKVIIETCLLTLAEKKLACELVVTAGADYVKTSTGFSTGGATIADVELLFAEVNGKCLVKASGGVRNCADAQAMIAAGASRIGTSGGVSIVEGYQSTEKY